MSFSSSSRSRNRTPIATLTLALAFLAPAAPAALAQSQDGWTLVRYTPEAPQTRAQDLALLMTGARPAPEGQPNNLNRRLVTYPEAPTSLPARRAHARAVDAARWTRFAETHLRDGDVLFRLGNARTHFVMNFSRVTALATNSRYSHTGVFRWNNGEPEVVDITSTGMRVQTFPVWMREVADNEFAVRRLHAEYRDRIPAVLAYLEAMEVERPEFDFVFQPENGKFYCNELTEMAFRHAGLPLSEPVPGVELPGMHKVPVWSWLIEIVGGLDMRTPVYVAGNQEYGLYGSDKLEPVYSTATDGLPQLGPTPVVVALAD